MKTEFQHFNMSNPKDCERVYQLIKRAKTTVPTIKLATIVDRLDGTNYPRYVADTTEEEE